MRLFSQRILLLCALQVDLEQSTLVEQVIELELGNGFITAKVQGSRDAPYLVRMRLSMLSSTDWKKVIKALGEDEQYASRLVAGEIGPEFERMVLVGNVAPDIWMTKATGLPVGPEALLEATVRALEELGG